ncbi:MAG TPA: hypothetical protein DEB10_10410, partial [Ruminococcaceae bacterium]|nr:hypothetical protein [Oscillospiraceae bacterium]
RQRETISNFLSNCGISVDWGMTLSMFDFFLQEQLGTGKLSQQMYDDIYNILSPAQERRDEIEIQ